MTVEGQIRILFARRFTGRYPHTECAPYRIDAAIQGGIAIEGPESHLKVFMELLICVALLE